MSKIGSLEFELLAQTGQIDSALEETGARIQGLSDVSQKSGKSMKEAFEKAGDDINKTWSQLDDIAARLQTQAQQLKSEYASVQEELKKIQGTNNTTVTQEEVFELRRKAAALKEAMEINKQATATLDEQAAALARTEEKMGKMAEQSARASEANTSLRTQLRNVVEQLAEMEQAGLRGTEAYQKLQKEAGRLKDAMGDAQMQAQILAHDNAGLQGVISAVSGVSGAFSAAQGVIGLFGAENENLQKIMLRVQSLMGITMGLQQVANTLNKDSYFSVVILQKIREKYNAEMAKSPAVIGAATVAQTAQTAAATAGTVANTGLAGAFRMVGAAIKSVPVFGWIAAAVAALVGVISKFVSKAKEARKATEELQKSVASNAAPAISAVKELSVAWNALGNDMAAKKKFFEEHREQFNKLGVAVNDVNEAETLLKNNAAAYIQAQMAKAKADAARTLQQENLKKALQLEQEIETMPDTTTVTQTSNYGVAGTYTVENTAKTKKKKELEELNAIIEKGYQDAAKYEEEGRRLLEEAGLKASGSASAGSGSGTGKATGSSGGSAKEKDFSAELNEKKKAYEDFKKWATSSDSIVREAANQEYSELLKGGANYVDYLKNLRAELIAGMTGEGSEEQRSQLAAINNAIAEETKGAALAEFRAGLQEQLDGANSILEVLNIIQERRQELEGDDSELGKSKGEALDEAESDATQQQKEQTEELLTQYADYLDQKIELAQKYQEDMALLEAALTQTEDEEEKKRIERAMENRSRLYDQQSGADYEALISEFGSFEEKKAQIEQEYAEKRKQAQILAAETGNTAILDALDKAQEKEISKLAAQTLTASESWSELFGNLDELTATQIEDLVAEIESQFSSLSGTFDPVDLQTVTNKLNEAKKVLVEGNPFKAMGQSIKAIFNSASSDSKTSAKDIKKNWKQLGESTAESFAFVTDAINSCGPLKEAIGDVGATALSSLASTAAVAVGVATAIKTAEKSSVILAIIQAALVVVDAVVNVIKAICGNLDKQIDDQIKEHEKTINRLSNAYNQLSWEIDRALGEDYYKKQQEAIKNLQEQNRQLQIQANLEKQKKDSDSEKIADYNEKMKQNLRTIQDTIAEITEEITQTNAKDFASQLADGITDLFGTGLSQSKIRQTAEQVAKEVMANAVKAAISKQFLTVPLQQALQQLQQAMGFREDGTGSFNGLTEMEQQQFKDKVSAIAAQYAEAMKVYQDLFKELDATDTSTLAGAIAGASQESIDLLAGQTNAVRENQVISIDILRDQLIHLANIDARMGEANTIIRDIYDELRSYSGISEELRAQGKTY